MPAGLPPPCAAPRQATSVSAVLASYRRALDAAGPKATVSKALLDADDLPAQLPLDVQVNKPRAWTGADADEPDVTRLLGLPNLWVSDREVYIANYKWKWDSRPQCGSPSGVELTLIAQMRP